MGTEMGYTGGITCAMACTDLERSIAWYTEVLGLEVIYKLEEMGWCEFQSPASGVVLGLSQVEKPEVKGGATIVFSVEDIDRARAWLEGRDVPFDGRTATIPDEVRLATFYDPDGNKLMLAEAIKGKS